MNGIMPGPLWLAIASAEKGGSSENRTLNHYSENDTVTAKTANSQKGITVHGRKATGGQKRKRNGG